MRYDLIRSVHPLRAADSGRSIVSWSDLAPTPQIPIPAGFDASAVVKSMEQLTWDSLSKATVQTDPGAMAHAGTQLAPSHVMRQAQAPKESSPWVNTDSPEHHLAHARGMMQVAYNKFQEHNHSNETGFAVGPKPDEERSSHFAKKYHEAKAHVDHYERQGIQDTPEHHLDWDTHYTMNHMPSESEGGHWKNPGSISMRQAHSEFRMHGQAQPGMAGLSASPQQAQAMRTAAQQPQATQAPAPGQSPEPTPTPSKAQVRGLSTTSPERPLAKPPGAEIGAKPIGGEEKTGVYKKSIDILNSLLKAYIGTSTPGSLQKVSEPPKEDLGKESHNKKMQAVSHLFLHNHFSEIVRGGRDPEHDGHNRMRAAHHGQKAKELLDQGHKPEDKHWKELHSHHTNKMHELSMRGGPDKKPSTRPSAPVQTNRAEEHSLGPNRLSKLMHSASLYDSSKRAVKDQRILYDRIRPEFLTSAQTGKAIPINIPSIKSGDDDDAENKAEKSFQLITSMLL